MTRKLSNRIEAAEGMYFYLTDSNPSPYYLGQKEYHGYFSRSFEGGYSPVGKQKPFTFVAKDMEDLHEKIKKGKENPIAAEELVDWVEDRERG